MADLTLNATMVVEDDDNDPLPLQVTDLLATVASGKFLRNHQSVGTAEEVILLGECSAPGYAIFINRDDTNFVNLKTGTGGTIFARLDAGGGFAFLKLGSGAQAPWAIADTAACIVDILIANTT